MSKHYKKGELTTVVIDSTNRSGGTAENAQYNIAWDNFLTSGKYKMSWRYMEFDGVAPPNPPTSLVATTTGTTTASISFTASVGATSYTVTSSPGGFIGAGSASPIVVSGLSPNTIYTFTATATNAGGTSVASSPSNSITTISSPPTSLVATATGVTTASITFTAPSGTGIITSYTVTSSRGGFTGAGSASPIVVSGLTSNTSYTFTATATNAGGTSVASSPSNSITTFRVNSETSVVPTISNGYTITNNNGTIMINDPARGFVFRFIGNNSLSLNVATPLNSTKTFWVSTTTPASGSNNIFSTTKIPIWFNGTALLRASVNFPGTDVTSTIAQTSTWLFYAVTTTPTTTSMYINGNLVASSAVAWTGDSDPMFIGAYQGTSFLNNGFIDDIRLYSFILTQPEILSLHTESMRTIVDPAFLVLYYTFNTGTTTGLNIGNQATGSVVYDASLSGTTVITTEKMSSPNNDNGGVIINRAISTAGFSGISFSFWATSTVLNNGYPFYFTLQDTLGYPSGNRFYITANNAGNQISVNGSLTPATILVANTLYHIVVTITSGNVGNVYVNNVLTNTGTVSYPYFTNTTGRNAIGRDFAGGGRGIQGTMDNVRVYNRVITTTEVNTLYINGV